jgi:hypothetical protein
LGLTREFYPSNITALSKRLLEDVRTCAEKTKNITLLGGWAVHELVKDAYAMESQDIDLLIHSDLAWDALIKLLTEKGGQWRIFKDRDGRKYRDHRIIFPKQEPMAVDIFYTDDLNPEKIRELFATEWIKGYKEMRYTSFIPSIESIIFDKFDTLPKRQGTLKILKDVLDIYALLFHNRRNLSVKELWTKDIDEMAKTREHIIRDILNEEKYSSEINEILKLIHEKTKG